MDVVILFGWEAHWSDFLINNFFIMPPIRRMIVMNLLKKQAQRALKILKSLLKRKVI